MRSATAPFFSVSQRPRFGETPDKALSDARQSIEFFLRLQGFPVTALEQAASAVHVKADLQGLEIPDSWLWADIRVTAPDAWHDNVSQALQNHALVRPVPNVPAVFEFSYKNSVYRVHVARASVHSRALS